MAARTTVDPEVRTAYFAKPGLHSHNLGRRLQVPNRKLWVLSRFRVILFVLGLAGIGYYGYALSNEYVYQKYENWAFDQQIAGHRKVTFADYLRQKTPFGFLAGGESPAIPAPPPSAPSNSEPAMPLLAEGSVLGRVSIDRLNLSAMVRQGVTAKTLSEAVGHVPSTALPGQPGNFAIAAHRDTLFRVLKDIRRDDLVTFQSDSGTFTYKVLATKIVKPSDVSVIRPDGGGLIANADPGRDKLLTMITCYPFYYVGSAPKRFIVEASLVKSDASASPPGNLERPIPRPVVRPPIRAAATKQASVTEPRHARGSSHLGATRNLKRARAARDSAAGSATAPKKKKNFWRRLFSISQG